MKKITIAGAGTLGSQIAWQTAFMGFDVTVFDAFEKGLEKGKEFHESFAKIFLERNINHESIKQTFARLHYTTNLEEAVKDADLISESVPESIEIKKAFYKELSKVAPKKTIFTTNSSTLTPSQFLDVVDRPEKFLALHFCVGVWDNNIAEIMGHPQTSPQYYDEVVEFAKAIGMVPILMQKEQPGYVLNSLLIPFLLSAVDLAYRKVSDFKSIDKTWIISNGGKTLGPFAFLDIIGLKTAYDICSAKGKIKNDKNLLGMAEFLKTEYLDKGHLGIQTGKGFYDYPNPDYQKKDFLK